MRNKKLMIATVLLVAVLMLGIGYAAISNITLNINGSATASPDADNFVVKFTNTEVGDENTTEAKITDDTHATIKVEGLTAKGDTATATYTISNESEDLSAALTQVTTNDNEEYFTVTTEIADPTTVVAGGSTTVTVTVELIKTPVDSDEVANINVDVTAAPVQP